MGTRVILELDIPEHKKKSGYKHQTKCPINIPCDLHKLVKVKADEDYRTISAVCILALLEYLEK